MELFRDRRCNHLSGVTARRDIAMASTAVAMAVAAALAASSGAGTAYPAKQTATRMATPTTSHLAARERPGGGLVLDCSTQSGRGGGLRQFASRWNLVVGPLAMSGAGGPEPDRDSLEPFGGDKFPLYVKSGHRVTLELSRPAWLTAEPPPQAPGGAAVSETP
jgi:hypothetical protein